MKVTKIDINHEELNINSTLEYYLFMEQLTSGKISSVGSFQDEEIKNIKTVYYEKVEYKDKKGNSYFFLIKKEDKMLLQTLIGIGQDAINREINSAIEAKLKAGYFVTQEFYRDSLEEVTTITKTRIKSLPWWKRLFNKF